MLKLFINTWGNYNENGADGGKWITLPMGGDELEEVLENIARGMGDNDPEFCIHDYEWEEEYNFGDIGENDDVFDLNKKCEKLDGMHEWEIKTFCAACEYFGERYVSIDDIDDYVLYEDIKDNYDLGYYWAVESGCYDLDQMGSLANYIDYEAFGRDISYETDGGFTSFGFVERV